MLAIIIFYILQFTFGNTLHI